MTSSSSSSSSRTRTTARATLTGATRNQGRVHAILYEVAALKKARGDADSMVCPERIMLGGMWLFVFGRDLARKANNRRPALVILTHGRSGSAQDVFHICEELLGADQVPGNTVCVVLEQRNHGRRLIEESKNVSFEANPKYAADMFAIMYGTALDMSFLIDMIPPFLNIFPISVAVVGVSTGGYVALSAMANDRRVHIGVSLLGSADYTSFLEAKAIATGIALDSDTFAKRVNEPLRLLLKEKDLINRAAAFADRPLLMAMGGQDRFTTACNETFLNRLRSLSSMPDAIDVFVDQGASHELTSQMVQRAVAFVHQWNKRIAQV